ncbi:hypothetical protein M440DRAFT_1397785 [Trichoderma longibrachiatum ATCC 18648]|uniref:Uncharacterized protein n=1 Tax=Trichoderma longibrachiatum ATCC 18648 TaxID=983965 RepID=A0A2T4CFT6_TRILO|nr:hypothetical protein M440DRAFT_1397785 [Trichoderma longibrachiatum ATCC 18648]
MWFTATSAFPFLSLCLCWPFVYQCIICWMTDTEDAVRGGTVWDLLLALRGCTVL